MAGAVKKPALPRKDKGREVETVYTDEQGRKRTAVTCVECRGRGCGRCNGLGFRYTGELELLP